MEPPRPDPQPPHLTRPHLVRGPADRHGIGLPPRPGSLGEYAFHLVSHLAPQPDVAEAILFADRSTEGPPTPSPATSKPRWRLTGSGRCPRCCARCAAPVHAVVLTLQFATFGDLPIPGGIGLVAPWRVGLTGTPVMVLLHNLADAVDMRDAGFASSRAAAWLMRRAGRMLTRALLQADLVALTLPRAVEYRPAQLPRRKRLVLAPHGSFCAPAVSAEAAIAVADGPRRILAFGKWGTYKTLDVLVEAYRQLHARGHDDLELVIAGTDSPNSAGYLAGVAQRNAGLAGLVLTGYVPEAQVPALFGGASVVAFPYTSTTGSSGVLHQAGEHGRAVVLPRIGDLIECIEEEGFGGVYFEPGDAAGLADALEQVLDDPVLRERLARRNLAAAAGVPIFEVAHWYVVHLRRVIGARAARRRR